MKGWGLIERLVESIKRLEEGRFLAGDGRPNECAAKRKHYEAGDAENLNCEQPFGVQVEFGARAANDE